MAEIILEVDQQGSMVIPAELREKLGIEVGTKLIARVEGDRLVLETPAAVLAGLQALFAGVEGSMVDELIAERRAEAKRELCD
jgi:AbrB family looped-hinge helix DNA binding protein